MLLGTGGLLGGKDPIGNAVTLEEAWVVVRHLSPVDKPRLIERLAPDIERESKTTQHAALKSLRGLWRGLDITEEEIDEARREMWRGFPRKAV